ncbi:MAG: hypothetical protein JNG84_01910 [Archangium sp.]|nr:hypothetical protein [Archangium sp.]
MKALSESAALQPQPPVWPGSLPPSVQVPEAHSSGAHRCVAALQVPLAQSPLATHSTHTAPATSHRPASHSRSLAHPAAQVLRVTSQCWLGQLASTRHSTHAPVAPSHTAFGAAQSLFSVQRATQLGVPTHAPKVQVGSPPAFKKPASQVSAHVVPEAAPMQVA